MIHYKSGDILNEDAEAVVNTVNCVGVMGRGIALQFKKKYPANFRAYEAACKDKEVNPGKMFVFETRTITNPQWVINFPTKRHWRGASRIEDIESGLSDLVQVIKERKIKSIAVPPLGAGLGGLSWPLVKEKIEAALGALQDVAVVVFEPTGAPAAKDMVKNRAVPDMTAGRAVLVELVHRYLAALLDPFVTLIEVHKLMYFMQESGEPLRLQYKQGAYGPYAANLRHVLNEVEGHFLSGYADGGDDPYKELNLVPGALADAQDFLQAHADTRQRFQRVSELIDGFESPMGMELLATVHWAVTRMNASTESEVVEKVHSWSDRKKMFSDRQIKLAHKLLSDKEWLPSQ